MQGLCFFCFDLIGPKGPNRTNSERKTDKQKTVFRQNASMWWCIDNTVNDYIRCAKLIRAKNIVRTNIWKKYSYFRT